jgi:hypothetical protein
LRASDFTPKLKFLDLFSDGESFEGLEENVGLFLTETKTDFFEDFALFKKIGNVSTGPNFNRLFLRTSVWLVNKACLFFDVGFNLLELILPVLMFG